MLQHFSELIDKVKAMPRTVVCVANADSETVEAARMALDKGLADVILYGDEAVVRPLVEQAGHFFEYSPVAMNPAKDYPGSS